MLNRMYRYALLATVALALSGCIVPGEQKPAPVEEAQPGTQQPTQPVPPPSEPVPTVPSVPSVPAQPGPIEHPAENATPEPKSRTYDWNSAMAPMVGKMLQAGGVNAGSVLLVDSVNNRTNGSLQTGPATEALRGALANNGKFTLVSAQQLSMAKQQLGLSPQDSLGSRSKAIGIARNVGAQYVLYANAGGNVNAPTLQMQLMLVQTGEIIWSGKGAVQQTQ
ncbi:penicillin-binding protein activator LpoB [Cronobacter dublinensis]|uniref:penicillin-binding protein activator LpoB n=1 Tax=Cronobacter dublinensis TaxID=413497 RepID=UPI000CFB7D42|nr:penicillin-binding protein activator LpoB [Cronobacter dublinensis]EKY3090166.1 penicillin-binding protein activator LpoB [Cronobacter dublinensis]ELQ6229491.1 penicillin-binding protein activator LpoB [Cronobacter dublinensis]ELY4006213.1 penicillin-binding protein activator LpoB [Cronobacter dublinensis]ELY4409330.1 penicillin-binding protein activator LpoB [Cronobacter dublinensis]ELY5820482.1 penicillin-binding protein activator LpoB [Cronobacter dublinensis]